MYAELLKPFQRNISDRFLNVVNELRKTENPGRVFNLTRQPTKDELIFLINNYPGEIGLNRIKQTQVWKMTEGEYDSVPIFTEMESVSDILAHYHPTRNGSFYLPSFPDILLINPRGQNFIIHHEGVTFFSEIKNHPVTKLPWNSSELIEEELRVLFRSFVHSQKMNQNLMGSNMNTYTEMFLEKMGVKIIRKAWKELPHGNPLSGFPLDN